ncbi:hypothetical protein B0J11DRAFT_441442 [Dendryphion nanum]|uniref:Uncharacterized protein n=1 Tax=Dendryphion nanum TaxID=256645 RepID=A0A9P9DEL8_9PLEO|nr:hypothetical protein B0J11DRAFT_441442 [Dendryphion nanum]
MSSSSRAEHTHTHNKQEQLQDQIKELLVPAPPPLEQSAYQATSRRQLANRSASPSHLPSIPLISTTAEVMNKPLPPSPDAERKRRKHVSLRSLMNRRSGSDQARMDPSRLQPQALHQRASMPTSPAEYNTSTQFPPVALARAHSASANYTETDPDPENYAPYLEQHQNSSRAVSMETYFEPQPPRLRRTFPESSTPSTLTTRDIPSDRPPRPHTWLSPTESNDAFHDASEVHLFAEATCGFSDGNWDFSDTVSPISPPPLQGSHFSRGTQNDQIPLPLIQNRPSPSPAPAQRNSSDWSQPLTYARSASASHVSSSALPRPDSYHQPTVSSRVTDINIELERLGISEEENPDDELPNYAQSQAEMASKRAKEARERARELEARWNSSRGGGGWRGR